MRFEIVKLDDVFSGQYTQIYTIKLEGEEDTVFEQFVSEYYEAFTSEVKYIVSKLKAINTEVSWNKIPFKDKEGKPGDGVAEFFDLPGKRLRLFCISYGKVAVVLGGGGSKNTVTWQEDLTLSYHAKLLIKISGMITKAMRDGYLSFTDNGFEGDLIIDDYADE
ncbi:hypothetical protein M2137_002216 [Parabacteroides sp. PFB2-10]|uniref:hypothetical protein n=1 Tax=Parabacteroides sp. PFB2-10 TaxID=1742405 RepID=UPI002476C917|nr:hypothetical protein [Parabacteroides sp. PFB2-10]MDH6313426.1 hypothetical protein [Parabacteroides sp. PFB2-10]